MQECVSTVPVLPTHFRSVYSYKKRIRENKQLQVSVCINDVSMIMSGGSTRNVYL